jgi:hypothetical protein
MDSYKEFYGYSILVTILKSKEFNQIKYQNIKNDYQSVIYLIKKYYSQYLELIKKKISLNRFEFPVDYYIIPINLYNKIKYFEEFELLSKEIVTDLGYEISSLRYQ